MKHHSGNGTQDVSARAALSNLARFSTLSTLSTEHLAKLRLSSAYASHDAC